MPDSTDKILRMKPALVASLIRQLPEVALKLVALRAAFPTADVSQMISREPALMLTDNFGRLEEASGKLTAILPGVEVDRYARPACPL